MLQDIYHSLSELTNAAIQPKSSASIDSQPSSDDAITSDNPGSTQDEVSNDFPPIYRNERGWDTRALDALNYKFKGVVLASTSGKITTDGNIGQKEIFGALTNRLIFTLLQELLLKVTE